MDAAAEELRLAALELVKMHTHTHKYRDTPSHTRLLSISSSQKRTHTHTHTQGKVTGRVEVDELLDVIFRDFCIGK